MLLLPSSGDGEGLRRACLDFGKSTESTLSFFTLRLPEPDTLSSALLVNQVCLKEP